MWSKYGKTIMQVLMAILVAVTSATTGGGHISGEEWMQIVLALLSALAVYLVPAVPEWPWMKTALAALIAGTQVAAALAIDGFSGNDLTNILIAVVGVILTAMAPANTEQRHVSTQNPRI